MEVITVIIFNSHWIRDERKRIALLQTRSVHVSTTAVCVLFTIMFSYSNCFDRNAENKWYISDVA